MSPDSVRFIAGLIPFLFLFHLLPTKRSRILAILLASVFFIGYASMSFLIVALAYALFNFYTGKGLSQIEDEQKKRALYIFAIVLNVLGLALFKYLDFFIENLNVILPKAVDPLPYLNLLLPLGISYYTFQSIAYLFDVYHENDNPEKDLLDFISFILFFPKFIAGPIERSFHFLPQLKEKEFSSFVSTDFLSGLKLFVWGLFKKVVVSTALWTLISPVFQDVNSFNGLSMFIAAALYPFQVYAEFSGYTDMAIGCAQMIGLKLSPNFNAPFASTSISEFWRRWHISLSSWVNDYIYKPLSMKIALTKDWGKAGIVLAIAISFLILGFWHGAQWTYLAFGAMQAILIAYEILTKKRRSAWRKVMNPRLYDRLSNILTVMVYAFSTIFFGVKTMTEGFHFVRNMFQDVLASVQMAVANTDLARQHILYLDHDFSVLSKALILFAVFFILQHFIDRKGLSESLASLPKPIRWATYYLIVGLVFFNSAEEVSFLYGTF